MSERSSLTETSLVVAVWRRVIAGLALSDDSTTGTRLQQGSTALTRALQSSGLATVGAVLSQWIRESFLYRWLTAEPDPEVVVIDLRETYTVGPILAVLDRVVTPLTDAWATADTESLAKTVHDALRDHPVRMLSIVALAALLTELALSAAFGTLASTDIVVRLGFVALTALGTQICVSWDQCTESATYRYLTATLRPPEPPESADARDDTER